MSIYQTAHYRVSEEGVNDVRRAIEEFVTYVADNEPGTQMYRAWQQKDEPTRFVHLFVFEDEAAQAEHGRSAAVRQFEAVYRPVLLEGPVVFTDYLQVASNR
jgi:quinol monooxygenase YgiN